MIEGKISKSSQRGITLMVLVVTIIVLLILAGITLSMITGDNGIIKQAKSAKQQTEIQGYKEELELIGIKVEKVSKGLNDKEYMDKYEEEIKKDEAFKEAEVTRKDDETIEVVTKEGYEFEVTKDKVEYIGEGEGGESTGNEENTGNTSNTENTGDTENTVGDEEVAPPDLQQSDIDSTIIPNTYTNQEVTVKITSKIDGYTLQYSKYGTDNWEYYTDKITAEHNGVIYVRLWNGKEAGGYTTVNIGNIDRLDPKEFSLNVKEVTENSITVEGSTEDAEATEEDGCSEIKVYYFSKDNGATWEPSEGQEETSYTFTGLTEGTDYQIKMKAVDNAGNDIETTTVTQKTEETKQPISKTESYVGNYADMNGDGKADGIIYADLAIGGSGIWNNNDWSTYSYKAQTGLKEYYIKEEKYADERFGNKTGNLIAAIDGTDGTASADRFYVMALEDINPGTYCCWYYEAIGKLDKKVNFSDNDFGTGKENTAYVMAKWNSENWGAQNGNAKHADMWGVIKEQVNNGWFVPSKSEWAAFGDNLDIRTSDYTTYGLKGQYWSSSQYTTDIAFVAKFSNYCCINFLFVDNNTSVRLSATF